MNIFNILKANAEIASLKADNTNLIKRLEEAENLAKASVEGNVNFATEKAGLLKQIEDLTAGHEQAIKDLTEKHVQELAEAKKSITEASEQAGKVAAQIVASKGLDPETIKVSKEEITGNNGNGRFTFTKLK